MAFSASSYRAGFWRAGLVPTASSARFEAQYSVLQVASESLYLLLDHSLVDDVSARFHTARRPDLWTYYRASTVGTSNSVTLSLCFSTPSSWYSLAAKESSLPGKLSDQRNQRNQTV